MIQNHIFISYAHSDGEEFARRLHDELRRRDLDVWLDVIDIPAGAKWDDEIEKAIRECWALIFVMSPKSIVSENCQDEWSLAINLDRPVIPVKTTDLEDNEIPFRLHRRQYVSFVESFDRGLARLRSQLQNLRSLDEEVEALRRQQAELQQNADHAEPARLDARAGEIAEQIAYKRRVISDPLSFNEEYMRATQVGIDADKERAARQREQIRSVTRRRVVGSAPQDVGEFFKDRARESTSIVNALLSQDGSDARAVSIYGRGGVGKTALACKIMEEMEEIPMVYGLVYLSTRTGLGITLEQIYLHVAQVLDSKTETLLNDTWIDESIDTNAKIHALLTQLNDKCVIILLDNMEDLLDGDGRVMDEKVRLFIDVFLRQRHSGKLLITSREPISPANDARRHEKIIPLDEGLPPDFAITLLREFDPGGSIGLRDADEALLRTIVAKTHGFPRALEAVAGILANDPFLTIEALLTDEALFDREVIENLVRVAQSRLDRDAQIVMQALAVFGRPITESGVRFLLEPYVEQFALDVTATLRRLARGRYITVKRNTGELVQHPLDRDYSYSQIPTSMQNDYNLEALERRAGNYYVEMRAPAAEWRTIADLEPQLAEFEHRVRAQDYNNAARLINLIDYNYLSLWGHVRRVAQMREMIVDKIEDKQLNSVNANNLGLCYSSLGRYDKAIEYYQRALELDGELNARGDIAVTMANLGTVYSNKGDIRRAIEYQEHALEIFKELGFRRNEGITVSLLGQNYHTLGQPEKAADCYHEALQIAREVGNLVGEGVCLSNLGNIYYDMGFPAKALDAYQQALRIAREVGDRRSEGGNLNNIGNIYSSLGDLPKSLEYYDQALSIAREIGDRASEGYRLANIGDLYTLLGNYDKGIEYHQQALSISDEVGSLSMKSTALGGLGWIYSELRKLIEAQKYYEKSLEIVRQMGDRYGECNRLGNLGSIFTDVGQHQKALTYHQQSLAIAREIGEPTNECMRLAWLGWTYFDLGEYEQALNLLQEGLEIARRIDNKRWEENSLFAMAWTYTSMGHYHTAQHHLEQSIELARTLGNPGTMQSREALLAELQLYHGEAEAALKTINAALLYETPPVKRRSALILRALILMRLERHQEARADYEMVLTYCEETLRNSPDLFAAKYSRAQSYTGLALCASGEEQQHFLQKAHDSFQQAYANCSAVGVVQYAVKLLDILQPLDDENVLEALRMTLNGSRSRVGDD